MATLTASKSSRSPAVVSGFVLRLARQSAALTQEGLAEAFRVDVTTVQGWESGRRPLAAMNAGDFLRLSSRLARLGAPPSTGRRLREAVEADQVLATGVMAGATWVATAEHPLAASVHRRTITNLITWPLTRRAPQHLDEFTPKIPRRGPAAEYPVLSAEGQTRFFDHLLTVADRGTHPDDALLRRQAIYLLGFDGRDQVVDWLRGERSRVGRQAAPSGDTTRLLEARSASVALASSGDPTHLHDFVDHMTTPHAEAVNLAYWAHWIGELTDDQHSDAFMAHDDTEAWSGVRLLHHLMNRLAPDEPHLPLNLHTLYTLIASRPNLLNDRHAVQLTLSDVLDRLSSAAGLSPTGRQQLAGLHYALRIANR